MCKAPFRLRSRSFDFSGPLHIILTTSFKTSEDEKHALAAVVQAAINNQPLDAAGMRQEAAILCVEVVAITRAGCNTRRKPMVSRADGTIQSSVPNTKFVIRCLVTPVLHMRGLQARMRQSLGSARISHITQL